MSNYDKIFLNGLLNLIKNYNGKITKQDITVLKGIGCILNSKPFEESEHPRNKDGTFTFKIKDCDTCPYKQNIETLKQLFPYKGEPPELKEKEQACLLLAARGMNRHEIAETLYMSESSVQKIFIEMYKKYNLPNKSSVLAFTLVHNLINLDYDNFIKQYDLKNYFAKRKYEKYDVYNGLNKCSTCSYKKRLDSLASIYPEDRKKIKLTNKDHESLVLSVKGFSYKDMGEELNLRPSGVRKRYKLLFDKLNANSRVSAVAKAFSNNLPNSELCDKIIKEHNLKDYKPKHRRTY